MNKAIRMAAILALAASVVAPAFSQSAGADNYKAKCVMCHGADGSGNTPAGKMMKTPSLKSPDIVKMTDAELFGATTKGKGKMPPYAGKLSDTQIKDVVAFIRTLQKK